MIPFSLKQRLLELSRFLTPSSRPGFIRGVVNQLDILALKYPRTLVFGLAGSIVGSILDAVIGFPGGFLGFLAGGLYGLHRDLTGQGLDHEISRVVGDQLFEAHQPSN